jgi:hypothetical protein
VLLLLAEMDLKALVQVLFLPSQQWHAAIALTNASYAMTTVQLPSQVGYLVDETSAQGSATML